MPQLFSQSILLFFVSLSMLDIVTEKEKDLTEISLKLLFCVLFYLAGTFSLFFP